MNYIVDDIGTIVAAVRNADFDSSFDSSFSSGFPFYLYGHRQEIANRLDAKNKDRSTKDKKYPAIFLKLDTDEDIRNGYQFYDLNLVIVNFTKANYNAEERYTNVFKPVLYPIYEMFLKKLRDSGLFVWEAPPDGDNTYPPHKKIDRPYYGTPGEEANVKRIFSDPLDAIEIVNLKIQSRIKCGV